MEQNILSINIADNYQKYQKANLLFSPPFIWLKEILVNMTGFSYPSGYAIISLNQTVNTIWAGDINEYPLYKEIKYIDRCIYIDNYEGPERAFYGWKNLSQFDIEKTFNVKFKEEALMELGGFPYNLKLGY